MKSPTETEMGSHDFTPKPAAQNEASGTAPRIGVKIRTGIRASGGI